LIYDKRGSGTSTGVRIDASTGTAMTASFYPDDLVGDALAALRLLQQRGDVDAGRIGFWGSSEGGMLATQVASRSREVAFAINSSGFMEPLWETLRYQVTPILRDMGASAQAIEQQRTFVDLWLEVARTGTGWERFKQEEQGLPRGWVFQTRGPFTSLEQLRWDWDHVLTFNPLLALDTVTCPVLALFGASDPLTPAEKTAANMRNSLKRAGHNDVTIKIFPNAGHSLSELPAKSRMAPGVFGTLRSWLLQRVPNEPRTSRSPPND
jgi:pimeloyl-ACP methyl ester carboxylesterase